MAMKYKSSDSRKVPAQPPQWNQFLICSVCENEFNRTDRCPISLGCGHTVCRGCLGDLKHPQCQFDQNSITCDISDLPVNSALLLLVPEEESHKGSVEMRGVSQKGKENFHPGNIAQCVKLYDKSKKHIEELALLLRPNKGNELSRPMQRKLVALINCQLVEEEGRKRALRAGRALGERSATELILLHQNPTTLSASLWAAVRARGCQFLGPAMQEEALKLIHFTFEDGSDSSELSRKVLVQLVVKNLKTQFAQASKTSIGHVVQLLYRASCFKVTKREGNSSLMRLKDEFLSYEELRREHDAQIVEIAREAGLRIAPDQWSALLYGDQSHKSYMQSIIDRLQSKSSFNQCIEDLKSALERSGDPGKIEPLLHQFAFLSDIDIDNPSSDWVMLEKCTHSTMIVVEGLINFMKNHNSWVWQSPDTNQHSNKYKTSMCRDSKSKGLCPRGAACTFAHTDDELQHFRNRHKKTTHNDILSPERPQQDEVYKDHVHTTNQPSTHCIHTCQCSTNQPNKQYVTQPRNHYHTEPTYRQEQPSNPQILHSPPMHVPVAQTPVSHPVVQMGVPQHIPAVIPPVPHQPLQMHYVQNNQVLYERKPVHYNSRIITDNPHVYQQNIHHNVPATMLQDHHPQSPAQNSVSVLHPSHYVLQRPASPIYVPGPLQPVVGDPEQLHRVPVNPQHTYPPIRAPHHQEPPTQPQIMVQTPNLPIQPNQQVYLPPNVVMHIQQPPQQIIPQQLPPKDDQYPIPQPLPTPYKESHDSKTLDELRKRKYEVINKLVQKRITAPKLQQQKFGTIPSSDNLEKGDCVENTPDYVDDQINVKTFLNNPVFSSQDTVSSGQYSLWTGTTCIPSLESLPFPIRRDVSSPTLVDVMCDLGSSTSQVSAKNRSYVGRDYYVGAVKPDEDEVLPIQDQRIVSKYGPIARNVRSKTTSAIPEQVTANANGAMRLHASDMDRNKSKFTDVTSSVAESVCTDVEPTTSVDKSNKRRIPEVATNNMFDSMGNKIVMQEGGREIQDEAEDLLLAIELQQIEMSIQRELQNNKLTNEI